MNDMERRKFDDSFQEAFKGAEVSPSENVWTNIELDLEKAEGGKMRRRLLFFKTLAAASVVFAMCVAGAGYYLFHDSTSTNGIAQQATSTQNTDRKSLDESDRFGELNGDQAQEKDSKSRENSDQALKKRLADKARGSSETKSETTEEGRAMLQRDSETKLAVKPSTNSSLSITKKDKDKPNSKNTHDNNARSTDSSKEILTALVEDNFQSDLKNKVNGSAISNANTSSNTVVGSDNAHQERTVSSKMNVIVEAKNGSLVPTRNNSHTSDRNLPAFYEPKSPTLQLPVSNADPGAILLAKLAAEEMKYAAEDKKHEKNKSEKLWTSVGFAAGGFNSLNPSVNPTPAYSANITGTANLANATNVAAKQSKASGVAYSVGFSVGTKLSNRWVLQGGFNYLTQSSDYTANNVVVDNNLQSPQAESLNSYSQVKQADASTSAPSKVAQTFPYTVNNNVQFVSVPVQAGYLVVNKKFGLQVNAGVSTDLFLQNTITPEGGGINKTTQGRGEDSPYRSLNFSGLMGTEFSYKLGYRYRVSLNPGLRYPLNSVYKSTTGVEATPLTFDVGLRFRYIFH